VEILQLHALGFYLHSLPVQNSVLNGLLTTLCHVTTPRLAAISQADFLAEY
jgi:hypothetical protein